MKVLLFENEYATEEYEDSEASWERPIYLTIKEGVETICSGMFENPNRSEDVCGGEIIISIPNSVKTIGSASFICINQLRSLVIPDSVEAIESCAFTQCVNLSEITLSKALKRIGSRAFENCSSLGKIEIPEEVIKIEDVAFRGCALLKEITLHRGLIAIGWYAFAECWKVKRVEIPGTVAVLGKGVFENCRSLEEIVVSENLLKKYGKGYIMSNTRARVVTSASCGTEIPKTEVPEVVEMHEKGNGVSESCSKSPARSYNVKSYNGAIRRNLISGKKK